MSYYDDQEDARFGMHRQWGKLKKPKQNVKHSSAFNEWYTPSEYVEAARQVMGSIDFDPASCDQANKTIKAKKYFSEKSLETPWPFEEQNIFLNPPGGKVGNKSQPLLFWKKLLDISQDDFFNQAIFVGFSIEMLQTSQSVGSMLYYPFCVPKSRIHFVSPGAEKNQPSHANVLIYVPGSIDRTPEFLRTFHKFGDVVQPSLWMGT